MPRNRNPIDRSSLARLGAVVGATVLLGAAPAAGLTILCGGAAAAPMSRIAAEYERDRGVPVTLTIGTAGQLRQKLAAGSPADALIITTTALDALQHDGTVVAGPPTLIGTNSIGIGIPDGTKPPDLRTVEAFEAALRAAKRIAVPDPAFGASSGAAFSALLGRLGLTPEIAPKETLVPGGASCEVVARGQADLCVQNVTEILPVPGVALAGLLPEPLQTHLAYAAGVLSRATNPAAAADFIHYATTGERAAILRAAGFTLPT